MKFLGSLFFYIIYYKILILFLKWISKILNFIFGIIYLKKHTNDDDNSHVTTIYYNEILILQQRSIYNVLNGHFKVPAILQKPF